MISILSQVCILVISKTFRVIPDQINTTNTTKEMNVSSSGMPL